MACKLYLVHHQYFCMTDVSVLFTQFEVQDIMVSTVALLISYTDCYGGQQDSTLCLTGYI